jgi:hypothetical protein
LLLADGAGKQGDQPAIFYFILFFSSHQQCVARLAHYSHNNIAAAPPQGS